MCIACFLYAYAMLYILHIGIYIHSQRNLGLGDRDTSSTQVHAQRKHIHLLLPGVSRAPSPHVTSQTAHVTLRLRSRSFKVLRNLPAVLCISFLSGNTSRLRVVIRKRGMGVRLKVKVKVRERESK